MFACSARLSIGRRFLSSKEHGVRRRSILPPSGLFFALVFFKGRRLLFLLRKKGQEDRNPLRKEKREEDEGKNPIFARFGKIYGYFRQNLSRRLGRRPRLRLRISVSDRERGFGISRKTKTLGQRKSPRFTVLFFRSNDGKLFHLLFYFDRQSLVFARSY